MSIGHFVSDRCRRARSTLLWSIGAIAIVCIAGASAPVRAEPETSDLVVADTVSGFAGTLEEVTITAERLEQLGTASSASPSELKQCLG